MLIIDSITAMVEKGSATEGQPKWWCENCRKSVKVLVEDMEEWTKGRKIMVRPLTELDPKAAYLRIGKNSTGIEPVFCLSYNPDED